MSSYWYQKVPNGRGGFFGGEQDCFPRWEKMKALHGKLAGKTVLDIGASEGFFSFECADRGAEVVSVEMDLNNQEKYKVARAARNLDGRTNLLGMDVCKYLHETDMKFDAILSLNVVHHLPGPIYHVYQVYSALKPGGVFYFEVPAKTEPLSLRKGKLFYLGRKAWELVLGRYFGRVELVNDWVNSVGNHRIMWECQK